MNQVAAGVIEKDGKILIAKRKNQGVLANLWEFPGGKIESGESPEQCLKRELLEELSLTVNIRERIGTSRFTYNGINIELIAFKVAYVSGDIELKEHQEAKWVEPFTLKQYTFVPGDVPIIEKLLNQQCKQ